MKIKVVSGQSVTGQNATMSKTDKIPQCKWCNKDTAKVLQGCNKSVTGVQHGIIRMQQKFHKGVTWFDKDVTKVLQECSMV